LQSFAECPADFTYIETVKGCYKVVTSNVDWWLAGLECQSVNRHSHLLVINDADEQSAVVAMLESTSRELNAVFIRL